MSKGPRCRPVEPRARAIYDSAKRSGLTGSEALEMTLKEIARQDKKALDGSVK